MSPRKSEQQAKGKSLNVHKKRKCQNKDGLKEKRSASLAPVQTYNTSNVTQNRITRNGLFLHGKTSSRVSRALHFMPSEEHQARANEDLYKILDLASCVPNHGRDLNKRHSKQGDGSSATRNAHSTSWALEDSCLSSSLPSVRTINNAREGDRRAEDQEDSYTPYYTWRSAEKCKNSADSGCNNISSPLSASRHAEGRRSASQIPNSVLDEIAKELVGSIGAKLHELIPRKDDFVQLTRERLQRIHRQSFKNNLLLGMATKSISPESLHRAAIFPPSSADGTSHADKDFRLLDSCLSSRNLKCTENPKVKVPLHPYRPLSIFQPTDVDHCFMPDFGVPGRDRSNNTIYGTMVLPVSTGFERINHRQLFSPQSMNSHSSQQIQEPTGMDILDYVDSTIDIVSNNNPTSRIPLLPPPPPTHPILRMPTNPGNTTWRGTLPTVSPIALPPFFNPAPRFYRRKVY